MRKIDYRAWNKEEKRFLTKEEEPLWCINSGNFCWRDDSGGFYESDSCELNEYTGLIDKNSKKIYEGDIISFKRPHYKYKSMGSYSKIVRWKTTPHYNGWNIVNVSKYEVIGNIYENPELIKI